MRGPLTMRDTPLCRSDAAAGPRGADTRQLKKMNTSLDRAALFINNKLFTIKKRGSAHECRLSGFTRLYVLQYMYL